MILLMIMILIDSRQSGTGRPRSIFVAAVSDRRTIGSVVPKLHLERNYAGSDNDQESGLRE